MKETMVSSGRTCNHFARSMLCPTFCLKVLMMMAEHAPFIGCELLQGADSNRIRNGTSNAAMSVLSSRTGKTYTKVRCEVHGHRPGTFEAYSWNRTTRLLDIKRKIKVALDISSAHHHATSSLTSIDSPSKSVDE